MRYVVLLALAACGGDPLRNFAIDAGLPDGRIFLDAAFFDAPDAAPCTTLATTAPDIVIGDGTVMPPAETGGTITDAQYKLVAATRYGDNWNIVRMTLAFVGTAFELAARETGDTTDRLYAGTWSVNGTELLLMFGCGAFQTDHYRYTVGSGTLEMQKASLGGNTVELAFDVVP